MIHLVSLLVAAALVSLQCGFGANAQIANSKLNIDSNLLANVSPTKRPRRLKKFVLIYQAPPETARHVAGTQLELECEVMGNPPPSAVWLKNGEPVGDFEDDVNDILPSTSTGVGRLSIKMIVSTSSPGDEYTCVGTAGAKRDSATTTIFSEGGDEESNLLIEKLMRKPSRPVITKYYNEVFQEIGTTMLLPCRVHSYSKTQIVWRGDDDNMIYGNSRMQVLPSGDLLISSLRWADTGNFTCTAKNKYGKDSIATFVYAADPAKPKKL